MTKKEEIIYMAGFFDGEGCVGINKTSRGSEMFKYRVEVQITQVDIRPLLLFKKHFGGSIMLIEKTKPYQDIHHWTVTNKKADLVLKKIYPYLIYKKKKVKLALKYIALPRLSNIPNIGQQKDKIKNKLEKQNQKIIQLRKKIYGEFKSVV